MQEGTFLIPENASSEDVQELLQKQPCEGIAPILSLVGDKWSMLIVMYLATGPRRFNQLKRTIGGITQRMLTLNLRKLERHGILSRTVHPTVPPEVEYALTPLGYSLRGPVLSLGLWVLENKPELQRAQRAYDSVNAD